MRDDILTQFVLIPNSVVLFWKEKRDICHQNLPPCINYGPCEKPNRDVKGSSEKSNPGVIHDFATDWILGYIFSNFSSTCLSQCCKHRWTWVPHGKYRILTHRTVPNTSIFKFICFYIVRIDMICFPMLVLMHSVVGQNSRSSERWKRPGRDLAPVLETSSPGPFLYWKPRGWSQSNCLSSSITSVHVKGRHSTVLPSVRRPSRLSRACSLFLAFTLIVRSSCLLVVRRDKLSFGSNVIARGKYLLR